MEWKCFDFIVVWIANDRKERNGIKSCFGYKKEKKEKECDLIYY